jgi:hypothetical protein
MKKSAFLSDILFAFLCVALFTLCLFRFLKISLGVSIVLSGVCGILAAVAIAALLQNRRKHFFLKKSDEAQKQRLMTHLCLLSPKQVTCFFTNFFQKSGLIPKPFGQLRVYTDEEFYFLRFGFLPVNADEVAAMSRLKTPKKKILLCRDIEREADELCRRLDITVRPAADVYTAVKAAECLPKTYEGEPQGKEKKKRRLKLCFAKTNARRFFVSGTLILLTSLLTPFPYYYLVFGSILCLCALLIRFFGYE